MLALDDLLPLLVSGGGAGVGLAIGLQFMKWLLTFTAGRWDKRQEQLDIGTRELLNNLRAEVDRMKAEAVEDREEIAEVRVELRQCEKKHAESEAKVARLEAMMQGYGDARDKAALIVAAEKKEAKG